MKKYVKSIVERKPMLSFPIHIGHSFQMMSNPIADHSQKIYQEQCNILRELAEKSNCVIVGRCADYALADNENCLHIFIYGDEKCKTKRIMEKYELTESKAKDMCVKKDKQRQSYYNYYSSKKWGRADSYDL